VYQLLPDPKSKQSLSPIEAAGLPLLSKAMLSAEEFNEVQLPTYCSAPSLCMAAVSVSYFFGRVLSLFFFFLPTNTEM